MKILTSQQIHQIDTLTIQEQNITSLELMERAADILARKLVDYLNLQQNRIIIFCGPGNNGGDGLAMSKILYNHGYDVECFALRCFSKYSKDNKANFQKVKKLGILTEIKDESNFPTINNTDIVVDALFGSGLSSPITGLCEKLVNYINLHSQCTVSIDIASGMTDNTIYDSNLAIIKPHFTFAIHIPFLSQLFPENEEIVGVLQIVDINLSDSALSQLDSNYYLTELSEMTALLWPRPIHSHKGTFGHALIVAGSYGKSGAAVLSAKACHRAGAGLVTAHIPNALMNILQISSPETMVTVDENPKLISKIVDTSKYTSIGVGPGIGVDNETAKALKNLILNDKVPMVIDADALNILSKHSYCFHLLPKNTILTPHIKEFERLFGKSSNSIERLNLLRDSALKYGVIIVLKGATTAIASPDGNIYFNATGNPAMATAGSGDVLTGVITALLGQKHLQNGQESWALQMARLGVYLHGLSGNLAAKQIGNHGIVASDMIQRLPQVYQQLSDVDDFC